MTNNAPPALAFDALKVAALRNAILDGRFAIDASAIAGRLIADARASLARRGRSPGRAA
jgi:anti-sigma28 factor (negative regulator of flagellin synthesis)